MQTSVYSQSTSHDDTYVCLFLFVFFFVFFAKLFERELLLVGASFGISQEPFKV